LFIGHSGRNDDWAIALKDWLVREGWSGEEDVFLDLDPERGIAAGQRWVKALEDAAMRLRGGAIHRVGGMASLEMVP
jgi:hypothetical protein